MRFEDALRYLRNGLAIGRAWGPVEEAGPSSPSEQLWMQPSVILCPEGSSSSLSLADILAPDWEVIPVAHPNIQPDIQPNIQPNIQPDTMPRHPEDELALLQHRLRQLQDEMEWLKSILPWSIGAPPTPISPITCAMPQWTTLWPSQT